MRGKKLNLVIKYIPFVAIRIKIPIGVLLPLFSSRV